MWCVALQFYPHYNPERWFGQKDSDWAKIRVNFRTKQWLTLVLPSHVTFYPQNKKTAWRFSIPQAALLGIYTCVSNGCFQKCSLHFFLLPSPTHISCLPCLFNCKGKKYLTTGFHKLLWAPFNQQGQKYFKSIKQFTTLFFSTEKIQIEVSQYRQGWGEKNAWERKSATLSQKKVTFQQAGGSITFVWCWTRLPQMSLHLQSVKSNTSLRTKDCCTLFNKV